jgi:hypothetical protein
MDDIKITGDGRLMDVAMEFGEEVVRQLAKIGIGGGGGGGLTAGSCV